MKVLVLLNGEFGPFQYLQQLGHLNRFVGRFGQRVEQLRLQVVRQPFGFQVDFELGGRAERMLFGRQPDHRREPRPLVGHQNSLDDPSVPSHRVFVVQKIVSGGPQMRLVLHEPHDFRGRFAAAVKNTTINILHTRTGETWEFAPKKLPAAVFALLVWE